MQALTGFVLLQADVTANDDEDKALLKHFNIYGPPAIMFLVAMVRSVRHTGYMVILRQMNFQTM